MARMSLSTCPPNSSFYLGLDLGLQLHLRRHQNILGNLSKDVFERRTSTGSGRFALLGRNFPQIFWQFVLVRVKILSKTNLVASKNIKRENASLPFDVRRPETSLLKLPIMSQKRVESSAYKYSGFSDSLFRSSVKIESKSGPSIEP